VILLDTNVVSEPLRAAPDNRVIEWIDAQPLETLFLSAITVGRLRRNAILAGGQVWSTIRAERKSRAGRQIRS
jgi:predicted nucleic acid-binding protein